MERKKMKIKGMDARISAQGLDERVVKRFKELVLEKYGCLYGHFGKEIEWAMRKHLEEEGYYDDAHTRTQETKAHRSEKVAPTKNEKDKRNLIYASYGDSGGNDGGSDVEKLLNPNEPGIPPSERTKRRIIRHLKRLGMLNVERINENAVRRIIGIEAGYDPRTINRYFYILESEDILSNVQYIDKGYSRKLR